MNYSKYSKKEKQSKTGINPVNKLNTELRSKTKNRIQFASEKVLAKDWLTKNENKAWNNL